MSDPYSDFDAMRRVRPDDRRDLAELIRLARNGEACVRRDAGRLNADRKAADCESAAEIAARMLRGMKPRGGRS